MTNTSTNRIATTASLGLTAALVTAAVAAGVIGSAGTAHSLPRAPTPNSDSGMHGDPAAAASYWRYQQQDFDCAEMAVADVVGEISGHSPSEDEVTGAAANIPSAAHPGPIYSGGRTSNKDLVPLLAHYGIPADVVHPGIDTLIRRLDQGRKMIVGVNDKILWNAPGNRSRENHFVVVIGIDTRANVVHVNDSGVEAGRDEQVRIATFEDAWSKSDNFTVVTR
ncbi:Papain-like cysteine protease AvrRpt2 [Mycobacterium numidiamassiliense]|uniref:Papain-like cysteine protease AvrRpt2 n=1 Tax=Mycobacterium numidiamassiliense TaxID=1841861 RepID=A0A2U3P841_9MYCO|nr:C39 family peptidase [Mycobacterium numidiamassiliense]SPM39919.1 Papain-like cysteine protease AvrRpt2 [Mycobacterium numidiamassiliense]